VDPTHINDIYVDGAFMANDKFKIRYELHYWETDLTGSSQSGWESLLLKGIWFPKEGVWGRATARMAVGLEWILDLGKEESGIGSGSNLLGPFVGVALGFKDGTTLIPLLQQFFSYSGTDVSTTGIRLIAIKPLQKKMWLKLDFIIPIEWENDGAIPANAELQLGKNFSKKVALYVDGLIGIGSDRPYDWGIGTALRITY